jgi:hypothetical protein
METINILLYTDHPDIRKDPDPNSWGVTDLEKFIKLKLQNVAKVTLDVVNRHEGNRATGQEKNAANKLTCKLLKSYNELWFFGYRQIDLPDAKPPQPHNELETEEQNELFDWMKTGGVLITGDHSQVDPRYENASCDDNHDTFLTLGRAIGKKVPRAGELRLWEGPPSNCASPLNLEASDTYNTQEGTDACKLDSSLDFQKDEFPQTIMLVNPCFPHTILRKPVPDSIQFTPITKLPDHMHEGRIQIPKEFSDKWPGEQRPHVIAKGTDKRFTEKKRIYDLLAAYDGNEQAGRIVADSSFHHYLNVNLSNLPSRKGEYPEPETALDDIAQFYGNLACWLAPSKVRERIKEGLLFLLAKHPDINELRGNKPQTVGQAARAILNGTVGLSRVSLLFQTSQFESQLTVTDHMLSYVLLAESTFPSESFLHPQNLLGLLIQYYQYALLQLGFRELGWLDKSPLSVTVMLQQFVALQLKSNAGFAGFLNQWIAGQNQPNV